MVRAVIHKKGGVVTRGLIEWYEFADGKGTETTLKSRVSDNVLTLNGFNFDENSGWTGKGLRFDGITTSVRSKEYGDVLNFEKDFSIKITVSDFLKNANGNKTFSCFAGYPTGYELSCYLSNFAVKGFQFVTPTFVPYATLTPLTDSVASFTFTHDVIKKEMKIYVGETLKLQKVYDSLSSDFKKSAQFYFGGLGHSGARPSIAGNYLELLTYNIALTPEEIQQNYEYEQSIDRTLTSIWYNFEDKNIANHVAHKLGKDVHDCVTMNQLASIEVFGLESFTDKPNGSLFDGVSISSFKGIEKLTGLKQFCISGAELPTDISIDLTNSKNIVNFGSAFMGVRGNDTLNLKVSTNNTTDMSRMFKGISSQSILYNNFDTSSLRDISGMFEDVNLTVVDLSIIDDTNITNMSNLFKNSTVSNLIINTDFPKVDNINNSMEYIYIDAPNRYITYASNPNIIHKNMIKWHDSEGVPFYEEAILDYDRLVNLPKEGDSFSDIFPDLEIATHVASKFGRDVDDTVTEEELGSVLYLGSDGSVGTNVNSTSYFRDKRITSLVGIDKLFNLKGMIFRGAIFDLGDTDTIDFSMLNNLTELTCIFAGCRGMANITEIKLNVNTPITHLVGAFNDNLDLVNLNLRTWNTSNVVDMSYLIHETRINTIDIGTWDLRNVTKDFNMLTGSNLKQVIYPTSRIKSSEGIQFSGLQNQGLKVLFEENPNITDASLLSYHTSNGYLYDSYSTICDWDYSQLPNLKKSFIHVFPCPTIRQYVCSKLGVPQTDFVTFTHLNHYNLRNFGSDESGIWNNVTSYFNGKTISTFKGIDKLTNLRQITFKGSILSTGLPKVIEFDNYEPLNLNSAFRDTTVATGGSTEIKISNKNAFGNLDLYSTFYNSKFTNVDIGGEVTYTSNLGYTCGSCSELLSVKVHAVGLPNCNMTAFCYASNKVNNLDLGQMNPMNIKDISNIVSPRANVTILMPPVWKSITTSQQSSGLNSSYVTLIYSYSDEVVRKSQIIYHDVQGNSLLNMATHDYSNLSLSSATNLLLCKPRLSKDII